MSSSDESEEDERDFGAERPYEVKRICEGGPQCVFEPWKIESEKDLNNWYKYLSVLVHPDHNQNSEQSNEAFKSECIYCVPDLF